jgi:hypothetical protein
MEPYRSRIPLRRHHVIESSKQSAALAAINAVLVLARQLAYAGKCSEVAEILDTAEYLPLLMRDAEDRTAAFREQLAGLAAKRPAFSLALERFDAAP